MKPCADLFFGYGEELLRVHRVTCMLGECGFIYGVESSKNAAYILRCLYGL
ncbi:hypothetical protein SynA1524_01226 [Synechococcus sp. A15-24]|nr:hypothetical protein SynA1524_01226 [Synechococcus sp. A15-24]